MKEIPRILPILAYHRHPGDFDAQIKYLKRMGYRFVHLRDVASYLTSPMESEFPEKCVVLTFDDAYEDLIEISCLLESNDLKGKATICVPTKHISENTCRNIWNGSTTLMWNELRKLKDDGFEIVSHSVSHPNFDDIKDNSEKLQFEIGHSKLTLKLNLDLETEEILFFCFPYGAGWKEKANLDQRINEVLRSQGYIGALRAEYKIGEPWDQYCIPRCEPSTQLELQELLEKELCCKQ